MNSSTPASVLPWLGRETSDCPCGARHQILLERVSMGAGALAGVAEMLPAPASAGPLLLLADPDTWDAAGSRVAGQLAASGHETHELLLPSQPHADDETLGRLSAALPCAPDWIIAVGSGTLNDLGKMLAGQTGARQLTVGTAASMNGYASSIAAMTMGGLKKTLPVRPPSALLLDTTVLAQAPQELNAAGFGDLLSKPASGADWTLGHFFFGETICPTALKITDDAVRRCRKAAAGIGRRDPGALAVLMEALLLSGISMSLAGASSPASGGEHLLSHYLDISADGWQRQPRLHGEQVAVGTLVSLALYEALRSCDPQLMTSHPTPEPKHEQLAPRALAALQSEDALKRARTPDKTGRRRILAEGWDELWSRLDEHLAASTNSDEELRLAGCPRRFHEIGVDADTARRLIVQARHMRDRYTVLDLAADLGQLAPLAGRIADRLA